VHLKSTEFDRLTHENDCPIGIVKHKQQDLTHYSQPFSQRDFYHVQLVDCRDNEEGVFDQATKKTDKGSSRRIIREFNFTMNPLT